MASALVQISGVPKDEDAACTCCSKGKSIYPNCVARPDIYGGACGNCIYNKNASKCSFRKNSGKLPNAARSSLADGFVGRPSEQYTVPPGESEPPEPDTLSSSPQRSMPRGESWSHGNDAEEGSATFMASPGSGRFRPLSVSTGRENATASPVAERMLPGSCILSSREAQKDEIDLGPVHAGASKILTCHQEDRVIVKSKIKGDTEWNSMRFPGCDTFVGFATSLVEARFEDEIPPESIATVRFKIEGSESSFTVRRDRLRGYHDFLMELKTCVERQESRDVVVTAFVVLGDQRRQ